MKGEEVFFSEAEGGLEEEGGREGGRREEGGISSKNLENIRKLKVSRLKHRKNLYFERRPCLKH